jgi:hypothetical protein
VAVGIGNKDNGKAALGVGHERHVSSKTVSAGAFWKGELATL